VDRLVEGAQRGGDVQVRQAVNGAVRHPHQRDVRLPRGVSQRVWSAGEHRAAQQRGGLVGEVTDLQHRHRGAAPDRPLTLGYRSPLDLRSGV
jgi:hypothetical protein